MIAAEAEVEKIEKALRGALNTDPTKLLLKFIRNNYLGPSNG